MGSLRFPVSHMKYNLFKKNLLEALRNLAIIKDANMKVETVIINNQGIDREGITITTGNDEDMCQAAPVFFIEHFFRLYERRGDMASILDFMVKCIEDAKPRAASIQDKVKEALKKKVIPMLMSPKGAEAFLANVPHRNFLDLAVYYKVEITDEEGIRGQVVITNDMAKECSITEEQLYKKAIETLETSNIAKGIPFMDMMLPVLTNETGKFGSNLMLIQKGFDQFCKQYDDSIYVLPSCVHDLYIIPKQQGQELGIDVMKDMVRRGHNAFHENEELLSENIYLYDRYERKLTLAS